MNSRAFKHLRPFALVTQRGKRGFTLVELLAVMALVAILLAVAMPAVTGIGKGSSMQAAISNVRTTISLARQYAVTKRTTAYVVFPNSNTVYNSEAEAALALRAYAVFAVTNSSTGAGEYLTEWRLLPAGIIFDNRAIPGTGNHPGGNNVLRLDVAVTEAVPFPNSNSSMRDLNVLGILPNGRISPANSGQIYLREGQSIPVGNTPRITPTGDTLIYVDVNPLTGSVRIQDLTP